MFISESVVCRMPHAFLVKSGVSKAATSRPYVRPWIDDDDDDDDARCHGDDGVRSSDVTPQSRRPFRIVSPNFLSAVPAACKPTVSAAGE